MIPESVNIGGHEINIRNVEFSHTDQDTSGTYDTTKNEIKLNQEERAESYKEQVLCHEIMHYLVCYSGVTKTLDEKDVGNETIPRGLENIFWRFLKDNTNFFERPITATEFTMLERERENIKPPIDSEQVNPLSACHICGAMLGLQHIIENETYLSRCPICRKDVTWEQGKYGYKKLKGTDTCKK